MLCVDICIERGHHLLPPTRFFTELRVDEHRIEVDRRRVGRRAIEGCCPVHEQIAVVGRTVAALVASIDTLWRRGWWIRIPLHPRYACTCQVWIVHRIVKLLTTMRPCRRKERCQHARREAIRIDTFYRQRNPRFLHIVYYPTAVFCKLRLVVLKQRLYGRVPLLDLLTKP